MFAPVTGKKVELVYLNGPEEGVEFVAQNTLKLLEASLDSETNEKSAEMVKLAVEFCRSQNEAGLRFVSEHAPSATWWKLPCLRRPADISGNYSFDFGMRVVDPCLMKGDTVKKLAHRTRTRTNSETTDGLVDKHSPKGHDHVQLLHGSVGPSAADPPDLCDTIIDGMITEDIQWKAEVHSDLRSMADTCGPKGGTGDHGVDRGH